MYNFILQLLIMVSLAAIIYLVGRAIPRIDENVALGPSSAKSYIEKIAAAVPLEKIDLIFDNLLEKLFRRLKIVIMKIDNFLTKRLSGFKPNVSGNKDLRPNIFENTEKKE